MTRRVSHRHNPDEPSLVKESDATDPNQLINRWVRTGSVVQPGSEPRYGDFSTHSDYHSALEAIRGAQEDFMALPSKVRQACSNDAGIFLDACANEKGLDALIELGLDPARRPAADQRAEADQVEAEAESSEESSEG